MNRVTLTLLGLIALVALGITAWLFVPTQLAIRDERQACEAVYAQLRRQIPDPAFAELDSCNEATIIAGEPDSYMVTAYYKSNGEKYLFVGQAWRSGNSWEATVNPPNRVTN